MEDKFYYYIQYCTIKKTKLIPNKVYITKWYDREFLSLNNILYGIGESAFETFEEAKEKLVDRLTKETQLFLKSFLSSKKEKLVDRLTKETQLFLKSFLSSKNYLENATNITEDKI